MWMGDYRGNRPSTPFPQVKRRKREIKNINRTGIRIRCGNVSNLIKQINSTITRVNQLTRIDNNGTIISI